MYTAGRRAPAAIAPARPAGIRVEKTHCAHCTLGRLVFLVHVFGYLVNVSDPRPFVRLRRNAFGHKIPDILGVLVAWKRRIVTLLNLLAQ